MKFLFVAYCFGNIQGQALIGVYKRGLRVALELCNRGHEVAFFCTGRDNFHDSLTALAEKRMRLVDFPCVDAAFAGAEKNRAAFVKGIAELDPDVVVIGEAPLAGTMLESTLCAVELGIPVVCLDNAYQAAFVDLFCRYHGSMFDGIVLTGPSSLHLPDPPAYVVQVSPYIEPDAASAWVTLTQELGLSGDKLVVVMAYDRNVERLATSLLSKLDIPGLEALFLSPDIEGVQQRLARLPDAVRARSRVIQPPPEPILFGLLQLARLAVGKCAFMQVTECLSLRTPIIGFYFRGDFSLDHLPQVYRSFAHTTTDPEADAATVAAARRLLRVDPASMAAIHDGQLNATARTAAFLEALPGTPRQDTWTECARLGFSTERVRAALGTLEPSGPPTLEQLRASFLRGMPDQAVFALACRYTAAGTRHFARLWGRAFRSRASAEAELVKAGTPDSRRQVLYFSAVDQLLIEKDLGEAVLPSIEECQSMGRSFMP